MRSAISVRSQGVTPKIILSIMAMALLAACGGDDRGNDVCKGVSCSGQGTCTVSSGNPICACNEGFYADGLSCVSRPDACGSRVCGSDERGNSCGSCTGSDMCNPAGQCIPPNTCGSRVCGTDERGNSCGSCTGSNICNPAGQCVPPNTCGSRVCGYDASGHLCGTCTSPNMCNAAGQCETEVCGNGRCGAGESMSNCCVDCGCSGGLACERAKCRIPGTSDLVWTVNSSVYSQDIDYKFYDENRNLVWPSATTHWSISGGGSTARALTCYTGDNICFGGNGHTNSSYYWGVGMNRDHACSNCCRTCTDGSTSITLTP